MASLRQVTDTSRHIIVIVGITALTIFLLVALVNFVKSLHPTPPPPPTVAFGKISPISFPDNVTDQSLTYGLNTLSGSLPDFGDRATVYKIQQAAPTLNALDNAKTLVTSMGYNENPIKASDTSYKWTNTDDLPKTLLFNIYTNNFAITSSYVTNSDVVKASNFPDENSAITSVMSFLQNATLLPSDIDSHKTKATLLSIQNGQLIPATSLSTSQIIQVDLFQQDVNQLPIFYPNPTYSTMELYVGGGKNASQIVLANFNHQTIASDNATYPIITTQDALNMLKKGKGYIASLDANATAITIRNIVLGYYMSDKTQEYLEPIIVFEGDHNFYAYVPAIKDAWINK